MFAVRAFNVELARVSVSTAYVPNKSKNLGAGSQNLQLFPKFRLFILYSDIGYKFFCVTNFCDGGGFGRGEGTREARVT